MKNKMWLNIKRFSFTIICIQIAAFIVINKHAASKDEDANLTIKAIEQDSPNDRLEHETDKKIEKLPNISFDEPNYEFGKVFRGNKVNHIFRFKNEGQGELEIKKARSSCGCTAAIISSKTIPYSEFGEVKVTFNTQSYSGKVTKKVTIHSNDPNTPKYKLTISGTVVEEVVVKPKRLDFSKISNNVGSSKDISVKSSTDLNLKINKIESTNPNVITSFIANKAKDGYIVNALLKKETDYGRINGNIYIFTNSKNQGKITIPFYGEVIGDISVFPPRISFGIVTQKKEMVFPAFAIVYNKDIDIDHVEVTPDFIDTVVTETKSKRKTYKIETILKKNSPAGKVNGSLMIFTNSKRQPVIEIPLTGTIKEG